MKRSLPVSCGRVFGSGLLAATLLTPAAVLAAHPAAPRTAAVAGQAPPTWATFDPRTRTARLIIISAYGQDTYNFNGASRGGLVVTVPLRSRVIITYTNSSAMMPHGMEIVRYTGVLPTKYPPPAPAFPGAASPNYRHGTPPGGTQTVTFVASKAGRYLLICPVHNHVKFGHWAWFIVSRTATTATAIVK